MSRNIPEKPSLEGLEAKWDAHWEVEGTYRFDRSKTRDQVFFDRHPTAHRFWVASHGFSVRLRPDRQPRPLSANGRAKRCFTRWVGTTTGSRPNAVFRITTECPCDPGLPFDPGFTPPDEAHDPPISISRRNFIELCHLLTQEDEKAFEELWRTVGLSVDWKQSYATIDEHSQRTSQRMFLNNLKRGEAYSQEAPVLWDVDFQTSVAQAELQDREKGGAYHMVAFHKPDGERIHVETSRPELICSCVALVANPEDERYQPLFGSTVRSPLFGVEVPVVAHELADPEKGTGCRHDLHIWRQRLTSLGGASSIFQHGRSFSATDDFRLSHQNGFRTREPRSTPS